MKARLIILVVTFDAVVKSISEKVEPYVIFVIDTKEGSGVFVHSHEYKDKVTAMFGKPEYDNGDQAYFRTHRLPREAKKILEKLLKD